VLSGLAFQPLDGVSHMRPSSLYLEDRYPFRIPVGRKQRNSIVGTVQSPETCPRAKMAVLHFLCLAPSALLVDLDIPLHRPLIEPHDGGPRPYDRLGLAVAVE
jgi:hypothetical protein